MEKCISIEAGYLSFSGRLGGTPVEGRRGERG